MKIKVKKIIVCILITITYFKADAQITDCNLYCVTDIQMDSMSTNNMLNISIFNGNIDHLNYPSIRNIIDIQGDTVAKGTFYGVFYAHLGNATQIYPIPTTLDSLPANFSCMVYLRYNDLFGGTDTACALPYPCRTTGINDLYLSTTKIYPNPFSHSTTIELENENKEKYTLTIYSTTGQLVREIGNITSKRVKIERKNLKSGLYFFQIMNNTERVGVGKIIVE